VKVCHLAYDISKPYVYDRPVCFLFVKIFCCYVYVVSKETRKRVVFNDKEWKFKEQRAKMWGENIAGRKDNLAPVMVPTLRGRATFRRVCSHSLAQSKYI